MRSEKWNSPKRFSGGSEAVFFGGICWCFSLLHLAHLTEKSRKRKYLLVGRPHRALYRSCKAFYCAPDYSLLGGSWNSSFSRLIGPSCFVSWGGGGQRSEAGPRWKSLEGSRKRSKAEKRGEVSCFHFSCFPSLCKTLISNWLETASKPHYS